MKLTLCISEAVTISCQGGNKIAKGRELELYATEMEVVFFKWIVSVIYYILSSSQMFRRDKRVIKYSNVSF